MLVDRKRKPIRGKKYAGDKNNTVKEPIDFVVTWVDGSDGEWLKQREQYAGEPGDASPERFRDWGLLRYWFRGVESYAPWVRKVHFVTWGHLPVWLNTNHEKLHIIRHEDYIPSKYLPTFSSHTIEWNMHRIEGLADRFVYFNDDTFLVRRSSAEDFFMHGLPCGMPVLKPMRVSKNSKLYAQVTNMAILNEHYSPHKAILHAPLKWFNPKYGLEQFRTLLMLPYPHFYGFRINHMPNSFLKQTFEEIWREEGEYLDSVCKNRFRGQVDANQWLAEQWQYVKGEYWPRSNKACSLFYLGKDNLEHELGEIKSMLISPKCLMTCINDGDLTVDQFKLAKSELKAIFETVLPRKSSYEICK